MLKIDTDRYSIAARTVPNRAFIDGTVSNAMAAILTKINVASATFK